MTKAELRKVYQQKRLAQSEADYLQLSRQLCDNFFIHVDLSFIKVVHVFIPIEKNREPNTWLFIDRIRREFPHIQLTVPRVNRETNEMDNFFFEGPHQLQENTWGILEPRQGIPTPYEKIDMVITPLLAFDTHGQRVGYGKGFYDKLFARCKPSCIRIGISLFAPVEQIDDIRDFDEPLSMVITSQQLYTF